MHGAGEFMKKCKRSTRLCKMAFYILCPIRLQRCEYDRYVHKYVNCLFVAATYEQMRQPCAVVCIMCMKKRELNKTSSPVNRAINGVSVFRFIWPEKHICANDTIH